jgi:tetratricopeptide (TPR) repeat protein
LDKKNTAALDIKANSLIQLGRTTEAYAVFETLFEDNPHYFPRLIAINRTLKSPLKNTEILLSAQNRLHQMIRSQRDNTAAWSMAWRSYINCLIEQNTLDENRDEILDKIRDEVQAEIKLNEGRSDFEVRKQELDRHLAISAISDARRLRPDRNHDYEKEPVDFTKILSLLTEAASLDPNSLELKRVVADLYLFYPVDQAEVAKIYDPYADPNPPAFIYDLLGTKALEKNNFSEAISFLEKARATEPDNPNVLNNLAWAYLSGTNTDPNRALFLSNLAITNWQKLSSAKDPETASHFLHTRGTAYLRLDRFVEAQADLSRALDGRPDHLGTLRSLIACCDATGDKTQGDVYRMRLEELTADQESESDSN